MKMIDRLQKIDKEVSGEVTPLFTPNDSCCEYFLDKRPKKREFILSTTMRSDGLTRIEGVLPLGIVGLITGQGGISKSTLVLQLAVNVAAGERVLPPYFAEKPSQVLVLAAEDDIDELHRRILFMLERIEVGQREIAKRLHVRSLIGDDCKLTTKEGNSDVNLTTFHDRLLKTLEQYKDLRLIILDPVSRFRGGSENDAVDTTKFVESAEQISKQTGATVLLVHHTSKAGASRSDQHASRGSSALVDGCRFVMALSPMTESDARIYNVEKQDWNRYVRVAVVKNNYSPINGEDFWLERHEGGILRFAPLRSELRQHNKEVRDDILSFICGEAKAGRIYSKRGFVETFAGINGDFELSHKRLGNMLKILIDAGRLTEEHATDEERKAHKLKKVLKAL